MFNPWVNNNLYAITEWSILHISQVRLTSMAVAGDMRAGRISVNSSTNVLGCQARICPHRLRHIKMQLSGQAKVSFHKHKQLEI